MAVIDERYDSRIDVGKPFIGSYFNAFAERMWMSQSESPDTKRLMDAEADARDRIAQMRERQAQLRGEKQRAEVKAGSEAAKYKTQITVANIKAGSDKYKTDRRLYAELQKLYDDRARAVQKKLQMEPEVAAIVGTIDAGTQDVGVAVQDAMLQAGRPAKGTEAHDAIAFAAYQAAVERERAQGLDSSRSEDIKQRYFDGNNPSEWMTYAHGVKTAEDVDDLFDDVQRRYRGGGGANPEIVDRWMTDVAPGLATLVETRDEKAGAPRGRAEADALDDAIKDLEKYADSLAEERQRVSTGKYPVGHTFLVGPNTYTRESGWRTLGAYGRKGDKYVEEVATELQRQGGRPRAAVKAIEARGGIESERRHEFRGDLLPMGDVSGWVAGIVGAEPVVKGDGGWAYKYDIATGDVEVVGAPAGHEKAVGKKYGPRSKGADAAIYTAITEKEISRAPQLSGLRDLDAMPPGVKALYAPAITAARKGNRALAEKLAREVDPEDVEAAMAKALVDDPGAAVEALTRMPEDVTGELGRAVMDRAGSVSAKSPRFEVETERENIRDIGRARLGSLYVTDEDTGEQKSRKKLLDATERREEAEFRATQEAVSGVVPVEPGRQDEWSARLVPAAAPRAREGVEVRRATVDVDFDAAEDDILAFADEAAAGEAQAKKVRDYYSGVGKVGPTVEERARTANALRRMEESEDALRFLTEQEAE